MTGMSSSGVPSNISYHIWWKWDPKFTNDGAYAKCKRMSMLKFIFLFSFLFHDASSTSSLSFEWSFLNSISDVPIFVRSWKKRPVCLSINLGGYLFKSNVILIFSNSRCKSSGCEHIRVALSAAAYGIFLVICGDVINGTVVHMVGLLIFWKLLF
jgi:hypothetical protein